MKRSKKLTVLLAVLAVAVAATIGLSFFEEKTEQIKNSDEIILKIDPETVTALSWEYDGETLAFHKEENWLWDGDAAFPVDQEKIGDFLSRFEAFGVSFVIENVEDYGQYGLDDPLCTVHLTAGEQSVELTLGDFSQMDSKRYVSVGDGNVYLVNEDPLDDYGSVLSDMIDHDEMPTFEKVFSLAFSGGETYTVTREEDSENSPCADDLYFTEQGGKTVPLDTSLVDGYLANISLLDAKDYVTYNATAEELADYGLETPELTVSVDYATEDEDGEEQEEHFTLSVSRDPEEAAKAAEKAAEDAEKAESEDAGETEEEEITAYMRVGESPIVYRISGDDYKKLTAASYDDLRHKELLTADFEDVTGLDISLEGESYTLLSQGEGEDRTWLYGEEEQEITPLRSALTSLSAEKFTKEKAAGQLEIGLTVHLNSERFPTVQIDLTRYDGEYCLASVDGTPTALIPRSQAVDVIEAVHAIVLAQ